MKIVRYFLVGGAAAIVDISMFGFMVKVLAWPWFWPAVASFLAATAVNYILSIKHVFDSGVRFSRHHEVALVFAASGVGLIVNQLILYGCIELAGMDPVLAKIIGTGGVFFWNYGARRYFIFQERI